MTGQEILEKAVEILGYTDMNGNLQLSNRITNKAVTIMNLIYSDLWRVCKDSEFIPIKSILEKIDLPERALNDVMPYGIAMMIAQNESDGDQQQLYSILYNRKKTGLSKKDSIDDTLPRCYDL